MGALSARSGHSSRWAARSTAPGARSGAEQRALLGDQWGPARPTKRGGARVGAASETTTDADLLGADAEVGAELLVLELRLGQRVGREERDDDAGDERGGHREQARILERDDGGLAHEDLYPHRLGQRDYSR